MKILILSFGAGGMLHYAVDVINSLSNQPNTTFLFLTTDEWAYLPNNVTQKKVVNRSMIISEVQVFSPDVIHICSFHPSLLLIIRKLRSYKVVYTLHDCILHPYGFGLLKTLKLRIVYNRLTLKYIFNYIDKIITLSSFVAGELYANYSLNSVVIPLVNYKRKFELIKRLNTRYVYDKKCINVLLFGGVGKYKGLDVLLSCVDFIKQNDVYNNIKFIVAGKMLTTSNYRESDNLVVINEFIDDCDIHDLFEGADVIFLPYKEASQSGVYSLSISYEKSIMTSAVGSFYEYASYYKKSKIFINDNPKLILDQIINLTAEKVDADTNMFSIETISKKYWEVYE